MALTKEETLALIPQQPPFRFIDEIIELTDETIASTYTFKAQESFYPGHFPGNPITPGAILLETMAQTGIVAHGIYLCSKEMTKEEIKKLLTIFTEAAIEFTGMIKPGDRVTIRSKKIYFRRLKIKAEAQVIREDGEIVCSGTIAGMGVKADEK